MPRLLAILWIGSLVGCAAKSSAQTGEPASPVIAVERIPERAGEFERTETRRLPQSEGGMLYRFRSSRSSLEPDVYIYPLTAIAREGGATAKLQAAAEAQLFKAALAVQQRGGRIHSYEISADSSITLRGEDIQIEGWHTVARLERGGEFRESHQHLFVLDDQIVKVRATLAPDASAAVKLESFLHGFLQELTQTQSTILDPLIGCYALEVGSWNPPLHQGNEAYQKLPEIFRLSDRMGTGVLERGRFLVRPVIPHGRTPSAYWESVGTDSLQVVWTNGFAGARLRLQSKGELLEGSAEAFTDVVVVGGPPRPQAGIVARRIACEDGPA